jgi:hypothetical protein
VNLNVYCPSLIHLDLRIEHRQNHFLCSPGQYKFRDIISSNPSIGLRIITHELAITHVYAPIEFRQSTSRKVIRVTCCMFLEKLVIDFYCFTAVYVRLIACTANYRYKTVKFIFNSSIFCVSSVRLTQSLESISLLRHIALARQLTTAQ